MKIIPINNTQTNKPNFKSCFRIYAPKTFKACDTWEKGRIRTSTNLFREDLDWGFLVQYLQKIFAHKNKVNTYSLAASDGSEAFSFVITVLNKLSHADYSKFLPIKASDIDPEVLRVAKSGRINIFNIEFLGAEKNQGINLNEYTTDMKASVIIDGDDISETDHISSYQLIKDVTDNVKFKRSDILTELKNIKDDGNSVVLCRNVFPYLSEDYTNEVIKAAKENLKENSLFIVGDYDTGTKIDEKLLQNGFFKPLINHKVINCTNIYQRGTKDEIAHKISICREFY